jgi:hypothetical protein
MPHSVVSDSRCHAGFAAKIKQEEERMGEFRPGNEQSSFPFLPSSPSPYVFGMNAA